MSWSLPVTHEDIDDLVAELERLRESEMKKKHDRTTKVTDKITCLYCIEFRSQCECIKPAITLGQALERKRAVAASVHFATGGKKADLKTPAKDD